MNQHDIPRPVRALLHLYPRPFRKRFQADYEAFLSEQRAGLGPGRHVGAWFWLSQSVDIVANALSQRVSGAANPGQAGQRTGRSDVGVPYVGRPQVRTWHSASLMTGYSGDLQFAARMIRRDPVYFLVAVVTLALGIGATTGIFTVVDQVLLRPPAYSEPDRLVQIYGTSPEEPGHFGSVSWPDFVDLQEGSANIHIAAYMEASQAFLDGGSARQLQGAAATHNLFAVLGVTPLLGRSFTPEEDIFEGPRAIVLSHGLWTSRFGADPALVGKTIELDNGFHTVVGVMPPGFTFPTAAEVFWTPLHEDEVLVRMGLDRGRRGLNYLQVVGRLGAGTQRGPVGEAMQSLFAAIRDEHYPEQSGQDVALMPLRDYRVAGVPESLLLFLWASLLVLAIACANVASVTLSRGVARSKEFAVRAAIGAQGGHTIRLVLTESLLVGAVGGLLGILLAHVLLGTFAGLVPESLIDPDGLTLDTRVLLITLGLAGLTAIAAGALPALRAARTSPATAMHAVSRGAGPGPHRQRVQKSLVLAQMVLAIVLMTGAGLLLRSFETLRDQPLGFNPTDIVTASVDLPSSKYSEADQRLAFYEGLYERLEAIPGVTRASATYSLPFAGTYTRPSILLEGETNDGNAKNPRQARTVIVDPAYLETMSVPLLTGRHLSRSDRFDTPRVAVVNQVMAEAFWPGESPVGKVFRFGNSISGSVDSIEEGYFDQDITVVGVAGVERREQLAENGMPEFYLPHAQMPWWSMSLVVETELQTAQVVPQIRTALAAMDPVVPLERVRTLQEVVDASSTTERLRSVLSGLFAAMAALLTMVGIYGVTSFAVSQRVREIGIRMALGARRVQVQRAILVDALKTTVLAVVVGVPVAFGAARLLASMLFGTSPADALTYAAVTALVVVTTLVACYLPARRASSVDPLEVIGSE